MELFPSLKKETRLPLPQRFSEIQMWIVLETTIDSKATALHHPTKLVGFETTLKYFSPLAFQLPRLQNQFYFTSFHWKWHQELKLAHITQGELSLSAIDTNEPHNSKILATYQGPPFLKIKFSSQPKTFLKTYYQIWSQNLEKPCSEWVYTRVQDRRNYEIEQS